jgi:hypothetical protein
MVAMAGKQKRRSSTTLGDRLDDIKDTINANHLETSTRLTALETALAGVPDRVTKLENSKSWVKGVWATVAFLIGSIATYLGVKH